MANIIGVRRVIVCFKCKTYVQIFEDNNISLNLINKFRAIHSGHPIQIINKCELNETYTTEKYAKFKKS